MWAQAQGITALESTVSALRGLLGNRLVTSRPIREQHTNTTTWMTGKPPDAVAYPNSSVEVQQVVRICGQSKVPLIAFGAGTSFEGQVNAPLGGVCIDFKEMNRVIAVHPQDLDCVVQPGVTRLQLNHYLRDQGLFFPVDPGADASLGGMASTRASGTSAVRYGTMKDNVMALQVVLANGKLIATSRRARKSSAGYDLTRLFVGAEGTLGIITELTLRLQGIPEATAAGTCWFPSIEACCNAAIATIQMGIPVGRVEMLDDVQIRASNRYSKLALEERPTLFLEFLGTDAGVREQSERFGEIALEHGGSTFEWAVTPEDRTRLWRARHDAFWAAKSIRPGADIVVTDVCVPISRLAECVTQTKRDIEQLGIIAPIFAHAGDGNFHANVLVMMDDAEEVARAKAFIARVAERALAMEGTCTGEHGIGQGKKEFLVAEHGNDAVELMHVVKKAMDPHDILNPGKIF